MLCPLSGSRPRYASDRHGRNPDIRRIACELQQSTQRGYPVPAPSVKLHPTMNLTESAMPVEIAERWFETRRVDDAITLLWEPHVVPLMRCNIWHVRGRDRDLLVDTGMGVASLREAARHLLEKPVIAVATHTHSDHIGSHHEFDDCLVHRLEADALRQPTGRGTLRGAEFPPDYHAMLRKAGYTVDEEDLITALPHAGYDLASYRLYP